MNILKIIDRKKELFGKDLEKHKKELDEIVMGSSFLVIGGAGSIGQAVVKEIFSRAPKKLHVVDISENNMAELVRDLRSSIGYIKGEFKTFVLDAGSEIYKSFINSDGKYNYVLNLSALKHVRSEKDPYTLMRMIDVNIFNTITTIDYSINKGTTKYFGVSTDKASNPVNLMGASKKIMEMFLMHKSNRIDISTARFANVAFSDGSLLHSFLQRINKKQPLVAPFDVKRYFVTPREAGELCLFSCILGENRDILFPKLDENIHLISFSDIAERFLIELGYSPLLCKSEEEARRMISETKNTGKWPCFFTKSDTTGEKDYEEFYTKEEKLDLIRFQNIGVIKNDTFENEAILKTFSESIAKMKYKGNWHKKEIVDLFEEILPGFNHIEKGKNLDNKM